MANEAFASKLKELRIQNHLTQQQVADAVCVKRSAYAYYEIGKSTPKMSVLSKLAQIYNISVDSLIGVQDEFVGAQADIMAENNMWSTNERMGQLSAFEQNILLKIRLMSAEEKHNLVKYLSE